MKTKLFILTIILCPFICFSQKKNTYTPKFEEKWSQVNDTIKSKWENYSGDCNVFPDSFAFSFWCNIQFYWDTYFAQLGLLSHDKVKLAKGGANNLMFIMDKYNFIPNANTDWGSNRSQPPYFSMMVKDLHTHLQDTAWLRKAYGYLLKEYDFWTNPKNTIEDNATAVDGLQRYFQHASKEELLKMYNEELTKRFSFSPDIPEDQKLKIAANFASEAETGMDFTTRFENRCGEFVAVDLNSNLYLYEKNFAWIEKELGISNGNEWEKKAEKRKNLINKYCWNEKRGLYLDYDFINKRHSKIAAATTFSPLYAGIATPEQAKKVVNNIKLLETEYGIVTTEFSKQNHTYQWDHMSVWAPMQALTIIGLDNYGFKEDAKRIAMKYLDLVTKNFYSPVPSSYSKEGNTVQRKPFKVYEKYAADGKINDREYNANIMWGWSAGVWGYAYKYVNK